MEYCTRKGLSNHYSSAYLRAKAKSFYRKSTQVYVAHTLVRGHYLRRPSSKDSIGLRTSKTQKRLSRHVKHAIAPSHTSRNLQLLYNWSHPLGPCKDGAWTWLDQYHHHKGEQVRSSSHRIFHKMDWGQTTCNNHIRDSKKVLLVEHNLQIRSIKNPNSWQWKTIRLGQLQRILQEYRYQGSLRLGLPPRVKRSGGKS